MKTSRLPLFLAGALLVLGLNLFPFLRAQEPPTPPPPDPAPAEQAAPAEPAADDDAAGDDEGQLRRLDELPAQAEEAAPADDETTVEEAEPEAAEPEARPRRRSGEIVRFGVDALLPADMEASEVVAIFGSVIADGVVHGGSVAVFGDNTANGSAREVVAVLGNVRVNGHVHGQVVAVMGNVQLGPNAVVDGEIVCVGGTLDRAPGAVVNGPVQQVGPFPVVGDGFQGLREWVRTCLLLARPLAFDGDVLWAWGIAFAFLAFYLFVALIFNRPLVICAETLEQRPGGTVLIAVAAAIGIPVISVVLAVATAGLGTILIGPVVFFVGLFGKAAFLTWLGRRVTLALGWTHAVGAVLIGGLILMLLYTIPFAGFLLMKLTDGLGLGMAVYAGIIAVRRPPAPTAGPDAPVAPTAPTAPVPPAGAGVPASASGFATGMSAAEAPADSGPTPVVPPAPAFAPQPPVLPLAPTQYSTLPRAGFWIRLGASFLDLILLAIVVNFINLEDYLPLWYGVYCVVLWALRGTTIGGIICGLKVVRVDDRKVDWSVALVRGLGGYLSLAVIGLGFIWVAFDPARQSWHDKIAGTTIVRVPKGVTLV